MKCVLLVLLLPIKLLAVEIREALEPIDTTTPEFLAPMAQSDSHNSNRLIITASPQNVRELFDIIHRLDAPLRKWTNSPH